MALARTLVTLTAGLGLAISACSDSGTLHDAPVPEPEDGNLVVTWTIENSGVAATCGDVNAQWVRVDVIAQGQGAGFTDTVPCSGGTATIAREPATYDVTLVLISPSNQQLNTTAVTDIPVVSSQDTHQALTFSLGQ